ncbi:hypothetical protein TSAR_016506 [Trichomalopsis sarcophagae]|uniref:Uncharacterized protein n=1 Tax=Trichomalopsis sarcophagae TaxID=543379 RepID=A0A232F0R6_9HYME|nr:hypothetical protein TSAR_016506 [Trichomalopsis sarcophagae]
MQGMHRQPLNSKYRNILLYFLEKATPICIYLCCQLHGPNTSCG